MALADPHDPAPSPTGIVRSDTWRWYICVLLLLATVVNYMDRLTVNTLAGAIQADFGLNNEQYGNLELGFGLAFAAGSLLFGWLVDRVGVYWLYPVVLVGWSLMGFLTGLSRNYNELLGLRILLGLFEAGHFPCGLKTVQQLMSPRDRSLGNSLLQGGTALGAILAPQAIKALHGGPGRVAAPVPGHRRGGDGLGDLLAPVAPPVATSATTTASAEGSTARPPPTRPTGWPGFARLVLSRRFLALAIMVICINLNWHFWRVWLPKFLVEDRGYARNAMLDFTTYLLHRRRRRGLARRRGVGLARPPRVVDLCLADVGLRRLLLLDDLDHRRRRPAGRPALAGRDAGRRLRRPRDVRRVLHLDPGPVARTPGQAQREPGHDHLDRHGGGPADLRRYLDRTHDYNTILGLAGWFPMIALVTTLLLWNPRPRRPSARQPSHP